MDKQIAVPAIPAVQGSEREIEKSLLSIFQRNEFPKGRVKVRIDQGPYVFYRYNGKTVRKERV